MEAGEVWLSGDPQSLPCLSCLGTCLASEVRYCPAISEFSYSQGAQGWTGPVVSLRAVFVANLSYCLPSTAGTVWVGTLPVLIRKKDRFPSAFFYRARQVWLAEPLAWWEARQPQAGAPEGWGGQGGGTGWREGLAPTRSPGLGLVSSFHKELQGITDSEQEGWFLTSGWPTAFMAQIGELRPRGARRPPRSHSESEVKSRGNSDWPLSSQ